MLGRRQEIKQASHQGKHLLVRTKRAKGGERNFRSVLRGLAAATRYNVHLFARRESGGRWSESDALQVQMAAGRGEILVDLRI